MAVERGVGAGDHPPAGPGTLAARDGRGRDGLVCVVCLDQHADDGHGATGKAPLNKCVNRGSIRRAVLSVDEDEIEVQLFDNGLVVEGRRQLPSCGEDAVYYAAGIPQGFFRLEVPLPAPIDPERVEARYDRGLLHVTLPKRS